MELHDIQSFIVDDVDVFVVVLMDLRFRYHQREIKQAELFRDNIRETKLMNGTKRYLLRTIEEVEADNYEDFVKKYNDAHY